MTKTMERLFWISLAGAVGTAARYLITIAIAQRFGSALPYGTLFVILTGCFVFDPGRARGGDSGGAS